MELSDARPGDTLILRSFPRGSAALIAVRLGITAGSPVLCAFVLPGGPVILQFHRQMIAVGHSLAQQISVEVPS